MVTQNYNEKLDFHNLLMSRCKSAPRPVPKGEPLSFSGLHFFFFSKAVIRVEHKANLKKVVWRQFIFQTCVYILYLFIYYSNVKLAGQQSSSNWPRCSALL